MEANIYKKMVPNVGIFIQIVSAETTWPLRHQVLRPGLPLEQVKYPEDRHENTKHFAIFISEKKRENPIGILSIYQEKLKLDGNVIIEKSIIDKVTWRLRGMAIEPTFQKNNFGTLLLNACYEYLLKHTQQPTGLWCNARSSVASYYLKNGFQIIGKEFDLPDIGPHFVMINLNPIPKGPPM